MTSNFIKYFITAVAFSPFLLIYWIVVFVQQVHKWAVPQSYNNGLYQIIDFVNRVLLPNIDILLIFIFLILLFIVVLKWMEGHLTVRTIKIASIDSSDSNINAIIFGYFLPALNLFPEIKEHKIYTWGLAAVMLIIILVNKNSYNFNPVLWALGYRHYKCTTSNGMSLLVLSKKKITNKNQITTYIQLTDYLLLNMTNK